MIALINKLIPDARPEAIDAQPPQKVIFEVVYPAEKTEEKQKEQPEIIKPKALTN